VRRIMNILVLLVYIVISGTLVAIGDFFIGYEIKSNKLSGILHNMMELAVGAGIAWLVLLPLLK
jgi:hypothetical protein